MKETKPHPIVKAIAFRIADENANIFVNEYGRGAFDAGKQIVDNLLDGHYDDLLPPADRPVLSDETIEAIYSDAKALHDNGPLSFAYAANTEQPNATIESELRAWEARQKKREGGQ